MLNAQYIRMLEDILGVRTLQEAMPTNSITKYLDSGLSKQFDYIDSLAETITKLKTSHIDEVLDLKLKLGQLVDTNYKLLQELRNK